LLGICLSWLVQRRSIQLACASLSRLDSHVLIVFGDMFLPQSTTKNNQKPRCC
jgi:hypothetical protein